MKSIAAGWRQTTLGEIAVEQLNNGIFRKNPEYSEVANEGLPVVWVEELFRGTEICTSASRRLKPTPVEVSKYGLRNGDILFCRSSLKLDGIGFSNVYVGKDFEALFECHIIRISPNPKLVFPNFLNHQLRTEHLRNLIKSRAKTSTMTTIDQKGICEVPIRLPGIEEQRRIAAILDQADALRGKRREALAKLDSLTQSIFIEMFGDPVSNPKAWPTAALGAHVRKLGSGSTPTGGDAAYKESGISLIRSLNVHDGEFTYKNLAFIDESQAAKLSNVVVAQGDVLLNITGASVARVCSVPSDVLPARVNQHVMIVRPKPTLNRLYLERLLLNPQMKTRLLQIGGAGATREAITKAQAAELVIPVPPINIQDEFAKRLATVQKMKSSHKQSLGELDTLLASLQHRAFQGDL